eukprot:Plantae.Rhodophyta-Purpureofilum_apyrenoidigerum.ctg9391.p1 GENE.Plantae.Rhodophyta-Purpureofilum_apyrenoidigerum.ctg9391~~Plantae.Rhodophyta-Purpureofilum_apyrenoidigerum.ctg9391.p1  ORF type:complete len:248 (+),score=35.45 Plantae.Rhodophyta-Purpureofilum_apyrenoidigerum.ctg9391:319-1062(+)
MAFFDEWFRVMPPVTRSYVSLSVVTTGVCALDMVDTLKIHLDWDSIIRRRHIWRIMSNFFYFGPFGLDFLLHMFFLYRYCKLLEINSFRGRTADFLFMLIFGSILLLAMSPFARSITVFGPSLAFMMVYVWGRRNERLPMNFLGLFNFRAPYLPWVLLLFSIILGTSALENFLGMCAGHIYYYLHDIFPIISGGKRILWTPRLLCWLVGNNDEPSAAAAAMDDDGNRGGNVPQNRFGWGQARNLREE